MPTFDFLCTACEHRFEATLPFGSKTKPPCPACKSGKTEKQISPPAIQFKGSGFYATDSSGAAKEAKETKERQGTTETAPKPTAKKEESK